MIAEGFSNPRNRRVTWSFGMVRGIIAGFSNVFIVVYCLTSEEKRDDFIDIVKDFTALVILT